jgi:hypothetical protein
MPFSDQRHQFTHEAIRKRMLEHITHLWGVKSMSSLDPFARLVVDTLANELHKISHEFLQSEAGLLQQLAGLLTPDLLTLPRPAHAVVQVQPADPVAYLLPTESLFMSKRFASKPYGELDTRRDIFLSAVDTVKLLHGRVAWLAAGDSLHKATANFGKNLRSYTITGRKLPPHTLWLGLHLHPDLDSLDRLGFYLDLPYMAVEEASQLFQLLPLSRWSLNGVPLDVRPGLCYDPEPGRFDPDAEKPDHLLASLNLDHLLEHDIKNTYHQQFMHLRQEGRQDVAAQATPYPAAFSECFTQEVLSDLATVPSLWLEIKLPANYNEVVLNRLSVGLNAVPVLNRRLHRLLYRARVMQNILPLPVGPQEIFLTVRSLVDTQNRVFSPYPLRYADLRTPGHYTVRRTDIERFDARDAREQLHHLLEVLRDESVAFAAYGYDTVQLAAQQLNEQIRNLERLLLLEEGAIHELPHYLLVYPYTDFDTLEATYWTTDGDLGNNILKGTNLQAYDITSLLNDQTHLLTTTTGGQSRRQHDGQLTAYRYALMSHDRLVTNEDICSFVRFELGPLVSGVTVQKGVVASESAKQGFIRTLDVHLIPAATQQLSDAEWQQLSNNLLTKLVSRSGQVSHYRVLRSAAPTQPLAAS